MHFLKKLFLIFCFSACYSAAGRNSHEFDYLDGVKTISTADLCKYVDGVQLEGGYVYKQLNHSQKYVNVSIVWDLPFNGLEASEAFAHGNEKFRESRLEQYNEHQAINLMINLILYYLNEGLPKEKTVFIFYMGKTSSLKLFEVAKQILKKYNPKIVIEKENNSGTRIGKICGRNDHTIEFITHYSWINSKVFENASTIVGFSWNGGFNKSYKSGDFVIPTRFMDISKSKKFSVLFVDDQYEIKNDLMDNLSKFINYQDPILVDIINSEFKSENPRKANEKAFIFREEDFHQNAILLGTWEIFEPSKWPKDVVIP